MHPIISLNSSKTPELCHPLAGNYTSLFTKSAILFALPQFLSLPNTLATNPQQFFFINWNLKFYFLVWTQFLSDLWPVIGCPKFWLERLGESSKNMRCLKLWTFPFHPMFQGFGVFCHFCKPTLSMLWNIVPLRYWTLEHTSFYEKFLE